MAAEPSSIAFVLQERLRETGLLQEIVAVCRRYHVTPAEVLSGSRLKTAVRARRHACWLLRTKYQFSFPEIGRALGINHTTALVAVASYEKQHGAERP